MLLRPLPYPAPAQLMYVSTRFPALGLPQFWVSVAEYLEYQAFNRSFVDLGAFRTGEANLVSGERPFRIRTATVDAHLLRTLGVNAARGRLFDDRETGMVSPPPVALMSYELWQAAFGARPMVGRAVTVDGRRLEVVGIMAPGADLMDTHPELWLPLGFTEDDRQARNNHALLLIGRLKTGLTVASAEAELKSLTNSWSARAAVTPGSGHAGHVFQPPSRGDGHALQMTPLRNQILGRAGRSIWVLQAAAGLVLLIACANVASLLLARTETRRGELAMRSALGARPGRLVQAAMAEGVVLSLAGGALGVPLAYAALAALVTAYPNSLPRIATVGIDPAVMAAALLAAAVSGVLFGLIPIIHVRTMSLSAALATRSRGSTGTTGILRRSMAVAEIMLAVVVLVSTGLLVKTVRQLAIADTGFDRSHLVAFTMTLSEEDANLLGRMRTYRAVTTRLRSVPGVAAVTATSGLPLEHALDGNQAEISDGAAPSDGRVRTVDYYQRVMSGYFDTMGTPIVRGRGFEVTDTASSARVAIVNETLARAYWSDREPIGRGLRPCCGDSGNPWYRVVGVAKDVTQGSPDRPAGPEAYLLLDQLATDSPTTWLEFTPTTMHIILRTALPLTTLAPTILAIVSEVDPTVPVTRLREMNEVFAQSIQRPRMVAQLLSAFSVLALLLAAIGVYGILAYSVAERGREIGIRMALGAAQSQVFRHVARHGLSLVTIGVAAGVASALALNRLIASLLFNVGPTDVMTYAGAVLSIAAVAALACAVPAWRASRLDPAVVFRAE